MAGGSSRRNAKGKRLLVQDVDRFSALPQEVQSQILSSVPTIDAAKVGLLSNIWRNVWFSLSILCFDYSQFPRNENEPYAFFNFIDQTITRHDETDVKTLEVWLWPFFYCNFPIKSLWVTFAIMHKVEKLVLYGELDEVQLPDCLFTCESLVKLELSIPDLVLPSSKTLMLPNLRKLKLKFLVLAELTLGDELFSNLPSLEKLSIFSCYLGLSRDIYISSLQLKEFIMCCCPGMENCSVKLQAPLLSDFVYISDADEKSHLVVFPSDSCFVINGGDAYVVTENVHKLNSYLVKVAKELFKDTSLLLSHWLVEHLSMVNDLASRVNADVYHNMMKLEIEIWPITDHVRLLMLLLSRCPNLDELTLDFKAQRRLDHELLRYGSLGQYGTAGYGKIKNVSIMNFGGFRTEMMLVRFFLENMPELRLMRIVINRVMARRHNLVEKITEILEYEKASPVADVIID